jgi:hypothetical protein
MEVPAPSLEEYTRIIGVSSADAPNDMLLHWTGDNLSETEPRRIPPQVVKDLQSTAKSFDCTPYSIDDTLKRTVTEAPRLRWLRIGYRTTSRDLAWVCQLRHLRGLSLRGADLRGADLDSLQKLEDLEWLDLSETDLRSIAARLPPLPRLQVLLLKSSTVTDADLPSSGQFPSLKVLSLRHTNIADEGLKRVIEANPNLRYLHFSRSPGITEKSFPELIKLKQLEYMHVGSTPLEDFLCADRYRALIELQRQLPKCYIGMGT